MINAAKAGSAGHVKKMCNMLILSYCAPGSSINVGLLLMLAPQEQWHILVPAYLQAAS